MFLSGLLSRRTGALNSIAAAAIYEERGPLSFGSELLAEAAKHSGSRRSTKKGASEVFSALYLPTSPPFLFLAFDQFTIAVFVNTTSLLRC